MEKVYIIGEKLPNLPWQEREGKGDVPVWRYSENPIINRNPLKDVARIFNSAVVPWQGKFIGVFRSETTTGIPYLYKGFSDDGFTWNFEQSPIKIVDEHGNEVKIQYAYDPRLVKVEDTYYVIWCGDFCGASLQIAKTNDFEKFEIIDNPFLPFNRNGVLFPRKIDGKFMMLTRPSDSGHTPFGDIFLSESSDLIYWGRHRHVMRKGDNWWQMLKIGAGAAPIETNIGWLLLFHGVTSTCNGYVYSMGAAILDIDNPSIVKHRCESFLITPEEWYEERGFVPNVVFPCAALHDSETGRIAIYYGSADTYVSVAFAQIEELVSYILANDKKCKGDDELGRY